MQARLALTLASALLVLGGVSAHAAGSGLPGDNGRPMEGIPNPNPAPRPAGAMPSRPPAARAPGIDLAVEAARAIAEGCKQYRLAVAVVNSEGAPVLIYLPDGSEASHDYMAVRKAYSAVVFKMPTSQLTSKAQQDPEVAARIKADPNLVAFSGGLLLKAGDEIIGALGVSGAEPGGHDAECGAIGVDKIQSRLK